ncbi:MAG: caspase family protein [Humidesulfovibrio sp.]|uniref:caspase family protein n=1 Tax=Humidesulfovibrio sp. TaxID=2910988 RepID=UPI002734C5F5|nr:caspase family protein [Humidesulfovibrio sp.]MDP2846554.1 caspase family protein [Humidesulfovibrio sp.]
MKYVGGFQGGKPHGQGIFSFPNGMTVEGEFRNGAANGQATMTMLDGTYVGEFRNGKPNGRGTATSLGGMKYVGEFKDGIFNGHGTATALDGRKYVGQWRDGKRNGQGTTTYADGRILSGIWADTKNTREISSEEFASILPVGAVQVQVGKSGNLAAERKRIELEKQRPELEKQELAAETVERQRQDAEHQRMETEKQRIKAQKAQLAERPKPSNIDGPRERRVALVIGNGAYKIAPLKNPTNDAQDMADALLEMGFDVSLKVNASHKEMEQAVREFGAKLKQGGLGLFYYAGHGVQVAGENYLIPVDTKIDAEADVKFGALNAGMALARMEDAGNDLNIVILDACRTNPFARSFRTAEQGLARMDAPKGSLIAYATAPGRVAADSGGTGRNGVYTSFLLRHMREPGQKVEEILKRVRADVVRATKDKQVPWESSSLIGDFYFVPTQGQTLPSVVQQAPATKSPVLPQVNPERQTSSLNLDFDFTPSTSSKEHDSFEIDRINAERGDVHAQFRLGVNYARGIGTVQNYKEAAKWFHLAADSGLTKAQVWLATLYDNGHGVPFDYASALKWYRKAADSGDIWALFVLGTRLSFGDKGVTQNYAEAERMYKKAAELGDPLSQFNLGIIYSDGRKASKNNVLAYKWITIAIAGGNLIANTHDEAVSIRERIAATLSPAEISKAQRLASQWRPKTPEELGYKPTAVADVGEEPTARGGGKVAARKKAKAMK